MGATSNRLEANGIGAFYCSACREKIDWACTEKFPEAAER
jgi:hypothetical protein